VNRNRTIKIVESDQRNFIHQFIPDLFAPENVECFQKEIHDLRHIAMKIPSESIVAALEGMKLRTDKFRVLANAHYPIMFIAGKQDSRIMIETIMEQALLPKHAELVMLSNVGHMGFIEAKGKTDKIIQSFAERVL
jgi:pimeloyl-ACP methyl ester carboxylesterase